MGIKKVKELKADIGIALDGDADRLLIVDEFGQIIDGDILIALIAEKLHNEGKLKRDTVVITQMSNLALEEYLSYIGVSTIRTKVGDRYVLEAMRDNGFTIGGEQSGHVILSEYASTGDGILTALHVLSEMKRTGKPLSELAGIVTRLPQVLVNVKNVDKVKVSNSQLLSAVKDAETELGETGRVLLRPSGTEPLIRVMVEAATEEQAQTIAQRLASVVQETCSL